MKKLAILIIEDEPTINRIISKYFKKEGYTVYSALDGLKGLELFQNYEIDFVCLDIMIPGINGWEVARTIRETSNIPIILMSALSEEEDILKGYSLHVDDYITKPFPPAVLIAKIKSLFERIEIERSHNEVDGVFDIEGINFDIASYEESSVIKELLTKDELTGVANRRYLDFHIANLIKEAHDFHVNFGVLFLDIDFFKKVNDTFGHNIGDIVLKEFAQSIKRNIRNIDVVARWGGEEFIAIIKVEKPEYLSTIAEKLRSIIENTVFDEENNKLQITVSIGGTMYVEGDSIEDMTSRADANMYESKKTGRNKVTIK